MTIIEVKVTDHSEEFDSIFEVLNLFCNNKCK